MRPRVLSTLLLPALAVGCSGGEPTPSEAPSGPPEQTAVVFQAVDAGTGGVLADDELTVRYLVRSPIMLDATSVEEVPASEAYRIGHEVARDSLVVEVRLEAPSYHTVDTALAVPRGQTSGPLTIRMPRRLGRQAAGGPSRPQGQSGRAERPAPTRTDPGSGRAEVPSDGIDRTVIRTGDRAFERGEWSAARSAYQRMQPPPDRSGAYAREYLRGLVRKGISHINLGEWGSAMETLEEAVTFDSVDPSAYLRLGQAQCAVGLVDLGRQTLEHLRRLPSLPAGERPELMALATYQEAVCAQREFESAEGTLTRLQAGTRAIQEFEAFLAEVEGLRGPSARVDSAVADARTRADEIREELRALGRGGG